MWTKVERSKEMRQSKRLLVVSKFWLTGSLFSCFLFLFGGRSQWISILPKLIEDEFLHHATQCTNTKILIIKVNELISLSKKSNKNTRIGMENGIRSF